MASNLHQPTDLPEVLPLSPRREMLLRAQGHKGFLIGLAIVTLAALCAVLAPVIAPHDPYVQDLTNRLLPPVWQDGGSAAHLLGTDQFGRDLLSRVIYGARVTMLVGVGAVVVSGFIGSLLGLLGGYFGGWVDSAVVFLTSVKLAMPGVLIALSLLTIFGGSLLSITLIVGFLFWDRFAIVVRTATQQLRSSDFITAAETAGASKAWIIGREILPNVLNQIIVVASLEMAIAILVEASLSFLGLGIQPPMPSWGLLVSEGRPYLMFKPYLINVPGLTIFVLVVGINLLGDGLRDILSPRGRA